MDEALFEGPVLFNFRNQCLPFSALDFIPLVGEIGLVQPKLTLGQFFDFRFGVNAGGLFNLPHPIQAQRELRDPGLWALRRSRIYPRTEEIPGKEFEESVKSRKAHWRACSFCLEPMLMVTLRLDEPDRGSSSGYKMDRDPQVLGFLRNCLLPTKV